MKLIRFVLIFTLASFARETQSQQYKIRVHLDSMTAEVVSKAENESGILYETVMKDEEIRSGLWDAVIEGDGILRGIRVVSSPFVNDEGAYDFDVEKIAIRSRGDKFPENLERQVPNEFIADPNEGPIELSWITDGQYDYTVGTYRDNEDAATLPVFTRTSDGEIRRGLWEENFAEEPVDVLTVNGLFSATLLEDGTYEFVVGAMGRNRRSGKFPVGYMIHNRAYDNFPIRGLNSNENSDSKIRGVCFNIIPAIDQISVANADSIRISDQSLLEQTVLDVEAYYEYYFQRSCGTINIDFVFDNTISVGSAASDVTFFLSNIQDARLVLREQADSTGDDEPTDYEMYAAIPFGGLSYYNQNGDNYTTDYVAVPEALYAQVDWFDSPSVSRNQTVRISGIAFYDMDTFWEFGKAFHFREHISDDPLTTENIYNTLLHEVAHCLGVTSRGDIPVERDGMAGYGGCFAIDLGPLTGPYPCDNYVELLDLFRFSDSQLQSVFTSAIAARATARYFGSVNNSVLLNFIGSFPDSSILNPVIVQMSLPTQLTLGGGDPQPGHIRSYDTQTQVMAADDWSLGTMGPRTFESYAFQGPPDPTMSGEFGGYHNLTIRDLGLLDLLGWNLESAVDYLDPANLSPAISQPSNNSVIEPNTPIVISPSGFQQETYIAIYNEPEAYLGDIVYFMKLVGTNQVTLNSSILMRGETYYVYANELNRDGAVESGQLTIQIRCIADQNSDGSVDPSDFTAWIANYNSMDPRADTNEDGMLSPADFTAWLAANNAGC